MFAWIAWWACAAPPAEVARDDSGAPGASPVPVPAAVTAELTVGDGVTLAERACATPRDPDYADWAGGLRMHLSADAFVIGEPATVSVTGADAGDRVVFHRGETCTLACPVAVDGACFQPAGAVVLGEAIADASGAASVVVTPDRTWGDWYFVQATAPDAPQRYLSQPLLDRGERPFSLPFPGGVLVPLSVGTFRNLQVGDLGGASEWPVAAGRTLRWTLDCSEEACGYRVLTLDGAVDWYLGEAQSRWVDRPARWSWNTVGTPFDATFDLDLQIEPAAAPVAWHPDADGDGWGDAGGEPVWSTVPVPGAAVALEDCDDADPEVHPSGEERCGDGLDQDCTGADRPCSVVGAWVPGVAGTRVAGEAWGALGASLQAADLDGDGRDDLIAGRGGLPGITLGHGAIVPFAERRDRGPDGVWSWPASSVYWGPPAQGDVDGDGRADLLLFPNFDQLAVFAGPLAPQDPWIAAASLEVDWIYSAALGHLVDDDNPDLVLSTYDPLPRGQGVSVVVFDDPSHGGTSVFGMDQDVTTSSTNGMQPLVADLDGDGFDDLVVTGGCAVTGPVPGPIACLADPVPLTLGVAAGDLDGDGRRDVLIGASDDLYVVTGPWAHGDALQDEAWAVVSGGAAGAVAGWDGALVVAVASWPGPDTWSVPLDGPGTYTLEDDGTLLVASADYPVDRLLAADFDADGATDLAMSSEQATVADRYRSGSVWILWGE